VGGYWRCGRGWKRIRKGEGEKESIVVLPPGFMRRMDHPQARNLPIVDAGGREKSKEYSINLRRKRDILQSDRMKSKNGCGKSDLKLGQLGHPCPI
jgi:hypothetical protein